MFSSLNVFVVNKKNAGVGADRRRRAGLDEGEPSLLGPVPVVPLGRMGETR